MRPGYKEHALLCWSFQVFQPHITEQHAQGNIALQVKHCFKGWQILHSFASTPAHLADDDAGAEAAHGARQGQRAEAAGRAVRPAVQVGVLRAQLQRQQRAAGAQAVPGQHQPPALPAVQ